ncbi:uncharacterized protein N7458_008056 [Penicillium daleae]|uniref:Uncharacterized protein n=1 Tax=Penicillium daleae TaxID=63821 RepID=A0AAD6C2C5_9EURO|nr:uncharacterized protein N7458_008056 [Penicillium daleae]KAJ5444184.1 hypothetical protein N7458_008056 [Penicillium daleae]
MSDGVGLMVVDRVSLGLRGVSRQKTRAEQWSRSVADRPDPPKRDRLELPNNPGSAVWTADIQGTEQDTEYKAR